MFDNFSVSLNAQLLKIAQGKSGLKGSAIFTFTTNSKNGNYLYNFIIQSIV